jgi:hypothetical protein
MYSGARTEAELRDRPLELLRCRGRRRSGERGEALESIRARAHKLGDAIVRLDLQVRARLGRQALQAGRGERQHLHVQPRRVHGRDPTLADLVEPFAELSRRRGRLRVLARAGIEPAPRGHDLVGQQVLLRADGLHLGASSRGAGVRAFRLKTIVRRPNHGANRVARWRCDDALASPPCGRP